MGDSLFFQPLDRQGLPGVAFQRVYIFKPLSDFFQLRRQILFDFGVSLYFVQSYGNIAFQLIIAIIFKL